MEEWLLKREDKNKIIPNGFGLKNDPGESHKISIDKNSNYRNFVDKLVEVDDEINHLKTWIARILREDK